MSHSNSQSIGQTTVVTLTRTFNYTPNIIRVRARLKYVNKLLNKCEIKWSNKKNVNFPSPPTILLQYFKV